MSERKYVRTPRRIDVKTTPEDQVWISKESSTELKKNSKISAETSRDGLGELFLSVWSQRQDETKREHADETDRKMKRRGSTRMRRIGR